MPKSDINVTWGSYTNVDEANCDGNLTTIGYVTSTGFTSGPPFNFPITTQVMGVSLSDVPIGATITAVESDPCVSKAIIGDEHPNQLKLTYRFKNMGSTIAEVSSIRSVSGNVPVQLGSHQITLPNPIQRTIFTSVELELQYLSEGHGPGTYGYDGMKVSNIKTRFWY
jgi:hypothetical protein